MIHDSASTPDRVTAVLLYKSSLFIKQSNLVTKSLFINSLPAILNFQMSRR